MESISLRKDTPPEFRPRARVLTVVAVVAFLILIGRLLILQVVEGERFTYLSENNRVRLKKVPGTRGMVFDRRGQLLVDSRPSFDLLFVPEDAAEPEVVLSRLAGLLGYSKKELLGLLEANQARPPFEEIVLGRDIDWRSMVAVEAHQLDLSGVSLRIRPRRSYVGAGLAAHLLGYIGEIGRKQLATYREKGYGMGDEIGQFGLERGWEEYLRGQSGGQQVEVDAVGRRVRVLHAVEDVPGHSVRVTLDRDLQETAYRALEGKEGSIVALDVRNGAVLALVSTPSFDPNMFARGVTSEEWRELMGHRLYPLNNRAIQGQYPPGSIFKIVMAIAALEEGKIQPDAHLNCPGSFSFGNRVFRDWKKEGHGQVDLHRGLVQSCDVYFYQVGLKLGIDRIAYYARALGLGTTTGVPLDHEKPGLIPDSEWKKRRFGQPWFPGETPSVSIGQGYVTVTPLQIANLVAAVANGGTLYRPWFVSRVESLDGKVIREYGPEKIRDVPVKKSTLEVVRKALKDVVNSGWGTGGQAQSKLVEISGKTGTAQVAEMRGKYLKSEHLAYAIRDHAWFVSYAPAEEPEIAVVVLVEHGGHGGSAAAPLAKQVIEKYLSLNGRAPEASRLVQTGTVEVPHAH